MSKPVCQTSLIDPVAAEQPQVQEENMDVEQHDDSVYGYTDGVHLPPNPPQMHL